MIHFRAWLIDMPLLFCFLFFSSRHGFNIHSGELCVIWTTVPIPIQINERQKLNLSQHTLRPLFWSVPYLRKYFSYCAIKMVHQDEAKCCRLREISGRLDRQKLGVTYSIWYGHIMYSTLVSCVCVMKNGLVGTGFIAHVVATVHKISAFRSHC